MRKLLIIAAVAFLAVCCAKEKSPKVLVLYYSQNGGTKAVAEAIQSQLGADIEAIVPTIPYDGDFQATIERSRKELDGESPEIEPIVADIKSYDVIFLGYPIWFGTYATPIETVLKEVDLSGKKVVPFCTFGSGGLDSSVQNLKEKLPDTEILPGYGVRAARIEAAPAEVERFLVAGGFIEGEGQQLGEFSETRDVTPEESALFDAAVGDYPMMSAKAEKVASRAIPEGLEYIFTAKDTPREGMPAEMAGRAMKVYVLAEDGKDPVFTQVVR